MSALFQGIGNYAQRLSGVPTVAGNNYSCGFWARFNAVPGHPTNYDTLWVLVDDAAIYSQYIWLGRQSADADQVLIDVNGTGTTKFTFVLGEWNYYIYTHTASSNTHRFYANGTLIGSVSVDISAFVLGQEYLGSDTYGEDANLNIAYFAEEVGAVWSSTERLEQMGANGPARATVFTFSNLEANLDDQSGNGHDWTAVGSVPFAAQPGIPGNTSILTAAPIADIPSDGSIATASYNATFNGVLYTLWFTYTSIEGENVIGVWPYGNFGTYNPNNTVFSPDADTSYPPMRAGRSRPMQVPVTPGVTYWFQCNKATSTETDDATLTLETQRFIDVDVPSGAIGTNDEDDRDGPALYYSRSTDYESYRFVQGVANGQFGFANINGPRLMLEHRAGHTLNDGELRIYDYDLSEIIRIEDRLTNTGFISGNMRDAFYAKTSAGNPSTVKKYLDDGTLVGTWQPTGATINTFAPSYDETILYYTLIGGMTVKRWDLVNDAPMDDLVSFSSLPSQLAFLMLRDDTFILVFQSDATLRRYRASDGALLNTYQFTPNVPGIFGSAVLCHDNNPAYFWMRDHAVSSTVNHWNRIHAATGAMTTVLHVEFLGDQYGESDLNTTPTPLARFGPPNCCPIWIVPGGCPPVSQLVD